MITYCVLGSGKGLCNYTVPFTGPASLIAVTPSSISLCPPEPLVIQVEAGGEYAGIQWTRTPIALNVSSDELVDFQQTFVRTVTSEEDWGLYAVMLALPFANSVNFSVTAGGAKSMSAYIATYTCKCLLLILLKKPVSR